MDKTALNLQQALQLEKLLGKETAAKLFHDVSRQSGELGKAAIPKFQPRTAIIGPQGVKKVALPPPLPPEALGQKAASAHLKTAYALGRQHAQTHFIKWAQENLGDPNFWQGGTASDPTQPMDPEQIVGQLPGGSFQGMQTKITPDGQKTVSLKVTPDALNTPDALSTLFQMGENAKVEICSPNLNPAETSFRESHGSDIPVPEATPPPI